MPSSECGIKHVRDVNLLGVLFSNHLSFDAHVNGIVSAVKSEVLLDEIATRTGSEFYCSFRLYSMP